MTTRPSRDDLRDAIMSRVDTFTTHIDWIGDGAPLAFADSLIAFADWLATCEQPKETDR